MRTKIDDYYPNPVIYVYKVSGGRIIGEGATVFWNLAEVEPGKYKLEVYADDGCGACNTPKAVEIEVVDGSNCQP